MQWRALICGCSIRTLHKGALPTTVLLWMMCISTAAPDSALRCSTTVGGRTRSRRLMAERGAGSRGDLAATAWWRARAHGAKFQRDSAKTQTGSMQASLSRTRRPLHSALLASSRTSVDAGDMNAIAGALDQGSEAEKQGAPLSPAAAYLPATLTAAIPASSQRCCRSSRRCR